MYQTVALIVQDKYLMFCENMFYPFINPHLCYIIFNSSGVYQWTLFSTPVHIKF